MPCEKISSYVDRILVIEEVDEAPYRVDRMFAQLKNSKTLKQVRALICGKFTKCDRATSAKPDLTIAQIMRDYAQIVPGPVLSNLQYGHVPIKLTIPFGLIARVDSAKLSLEVLENAVT